jgi:hypothetical protein
MYRYKYLCAIEQVLSCCQTSVPLYQDEKKIHFLPYLIHILQDLTESRWSSRI